ncbi:MAG TPA: NUDIX domain-containing protein [Candidatus Saccharimonadales bacterium]|nr:NUDIX domain-containing protein [Candidatus Saccharimonadales bacterium]
MAYEAKIHEAQISILRELLFQPEAGYGQLQKPTSLTSDHFNFHIKQLVETGYVEKVSRGKYRLTPRGKEYANKLDTDANVIERQPKAAVILAIQNGDKWLFQQRLKHPYFGFYGFPSGKIRWGETIIETAARELKEETGLAADYEYKGVYHEQVLQAETGEQLEDKIFHVVLCTKPRGELKAEFEGGSNGWMNLAEVDAKPKKFESYKHELDIALGNLNFIERTVKYSKDQF